VDDDECNYPQDFLNPITPNGLPPHELRIKINCPLILLRNLDPRSGLCNGTHLVVRAIDKHIIDVEIVNGTYAGDRVFIHRIQLSPSKDLSLPFKFKRKQFPIRLSFVMTINKAQGQTMPTIGVYLSEPVFSHRQLYVALSRGVSQGSISVPCKPSKEVDPKGNSTRNLVYTDVLRT
jgi:ATP-dependent DNA helicase PIF1